MTYRGKVKDGLIVLEGQEVLPEGADVTVNLDEEPLTEDEQLILSRQREALLHLVELGKKIGQQLPIDASRNVDHYLYGAPKR